MSMDILDSFGMERNELVRIASRMVSISRGFSTTGNSVMGESMGDLAERLVAMESRLGEMSSAYVDELSKSSAESSRNVLESALAGIAIGRGES